MPELDPESIDLGEVARALAATLASVPLEGPVVGRTRLRDAAAEQLGCSQLQAEQIVDTMIGRGFIRFDESASPGRWRVEPR